MTVSIRRVARLTVLAADGRVDVAVADDAVVAEVLRVVTARLAPGLTDPVADDGGFVLLDEYGEALSPEACVRDLEVRDGAVLHLRQRGDLGRVSPVDDIAEETRELVGGRSSGASEVVCALVVLAAPLAATTVAWRAGVNLTAPAACGVLIALAVVSALRGRSDAPTILGWVCVAVAGGSAGALAGELGGGAAIVVTSGAGAITLTVGLLTATTAGRWWRPLVPAGGCLTALCALRAGGSLLGLTDVRTDAIAVLGLLVVLVSAVPVAVATSGLGNLDDRAARGEPVCEAEVAVHVARASDDLTLMLLVSAIGLLTTSFSLASHGGVARLLVVVVAVAVMGRARSLAQLRHIVPVVVTGATSLIVAAMWALVADHPRALTPAMMAMAVTVGLVGAVSGRGVRPVTASRLRLVADVAEKVALIVVPLVVAGVFDLYRTIWELL